MLTDPALRERILHIRRHVPLPDRASLDRLDAIAISHPHHDHLDVPSLRLLERGVPAIAPRGSRWALRRAGVRTVFQAEAGDRIPVGDLTVEAVPADHDGRRSRLGRQVPALGYLFEGGTSLYFAGDTDLFEGMADLAGRVDVAALPVAGWGPKVGPGHLDPERAARAVAMIQPQIAIPIHWGTLTAGAAGPAASTRAPDEFRQAVARQAPGVEVRVLAPGERLGL